MEVRKIDLLGRDRCLEGADKLLLGGCFQAIHREGGSQLILRDGIALLAFLFDVNLTRNAREVADRQRHGALSAGVEQLLDLFGHHFPHIYSINQLNHIVHFQSGLRGRGVGH